MKVISIASIKGGTGKTLISINLAHALSKLGEVGLIDADIDSPCFTEFTNTSEIGKVDEDRRYFIPITWNGIKVWSFSIYIGRNKAVTMTGDAYAQILSDVANSTDWGKLDYIVIDLPAGVSDSYRIIPYIYAENFAGSIVILQPMFANVYERVLSLHEKNDIPIIGVIENMTDFTCPSCSTTYSLFGQEKNGNIFERYNIDLHRNIPIIPNLNDKINQGKPILEEYTDIFDTFATRIAEIPEEKVGLLTKVKEKVAEIAENTLQSVMINLLITTNKIGLSNVKEYNTSIVEFCIYDNSRMKKMLDWYLRLKDEELRFVKKPKNIDFIIETTFKTFCRAVMGKKKLKSGRLIDFDTYDAWLNMEFDIWGYGATQNALYVIEKVFFNEDIMSPIRERYGSFLGKFI